MDRLGLGASLSQENKTTLQKQSIDETLRKRILGKDHKTPPTKPKFHRSGTSQPNPPPKLAPDRSKDDDDGDEEQGRSSLGKSSKHILNSINDPKAKKAPKRAGNYLDEVLAEKACRHSRKRRKAKQSTIFS